MSLGKARETVRAGEPGNLPPLSSFRGPGKRAARNSVVATCMRPLGAALSFSTVLSVPYALDQILPLLGTA